jgi:hypothetical protein
VATKTISIQLDVYERIRQLKKSPSESFSQVLRRELLGLAGVSADELLVLARRPGGLLQATDEQLRQVDEFRADSTRWQDPWTQQLIRAST